MPRPKRSVEMLIDGTVVAKYDSLRQASLENHIPPQCVREYCRGVQSKEYPNRTFRYADGRSMYKIPANRIEKLVNGKVVWVYENAQDAADDNCYSIDTIYAYCMGRLTGKFTGISFRYARGDA